MAAKPKAEPCQWTTLEEAFAAFAGNTAKHQSAGHIKPFHWYVACRLVLEGRFHPDDITPRPPFTVRQANKGNLLEHDPALGGTGERSVLGGLKTKQVDVTVCKECVGPVIAVSLKGTLNAYRNLTNRMEEAVGDCTNLHIAYPALVYGFLHVLKANQDGPDTSKNDVAVGADGKVLDSIARYHDVMVRLTGRDDVRAATTRYEAVALPLAEPEGPRLGKQFDGFPPSDSPLSLDTFFSRLYEQYDRRYVFSAPALATTTRRLEWAPESQALVDARAEGFSPRVA
jgi:hypothetical protein